MLGGVVIDDAVNLSRRHTLANLLSYSIEHSRIEHASLANARNLFLSLDEVGSRHKLALSLPFHYLEVHFRRFQPRRDEPTRTLFFLLFLACHCLLHCNSAAKVQRKNERGKRGKGEKLKR